MYACGIQGLELNVGELQMYGSVNWLNALDELTKMKKGTELITLLFIFKSGVVLLAQERVRGKKTKPKVRSSSNIARHCLSLHFSSTIFL